MRIPRVYTEQLLTANSRIILENGPSHHLSHVLRLKAGDPLKLFNGNGEEYSAKITQLSKKSTSVEIEALLGIESVGSLKIRLCIGISRGERMDYALQKSVELGVTDIHPLFTQRCMVKLVGKRLEHRMQHWRGLLINACEQSGRCRLPTLNTPCALAAALVNLPQGHSLLLHHLSEQALSDLGKPQDTVTILVGPEGGLTEEERKLAMQRGFTPIRLGPRVMRTETAPIAAIAAIQTLWGDY